MDNKLERLLKAMEMAGYDVVPATTLIVPRNDKHDFSSLLPRLENWRAAVSGSTANDTACLKWASEYIKYREMTEAILEDGVYGVASEPSPSVRPGEPVRPRLRASEDRILDGWLVEAAWRELADKEERLVLKYRYVKQWSSHYITSRLQINYSSLRRKESGGLTKLKNVLDKIIVTDKIHPTIRTPVSFRA